ncbi:pentapeptide repeat-containing protein [Cellulomonas carbonis]|uniref:Pentapeptide repeat-containing protein n=1 Tax=Cellulomonas carbonis T26 TaxID=947969 RepID=A0A0A0BWK5_9CELL|nr:pentapeptide repeat-containing protein [Cellulomonas carbonis]KGM12355.1 hypothetical protein N868_14835 [Cellulomonas carbonis T26]
MEPTPFRGRLEPGGDHDLVAFTEDLDGQDASDSRFTDCTFDACSVDGLRLDHARLVDTSLGAVHGGTLDAPQVTLQDVAVTDCRIGAVAAYGSELVRVELRGGKVDYLNLRDADLTDVTLAHVVVGELDLAGARVRRLRLDACTVRRLDVTGATLEDVDLRGADLARLDGVGSLRGARVSEEQLAALSPHLAAFLGIAVG